MTDLFPILIITGKGHQTLNKRLCCRKAQIALKTPLSIGVINNEVYTVLPDWRNQTVIYPKILSVFSHKCIVQNLTNRNPVWIMKKSRVRTDMSRKNNKYTKEKDVYDIIAGTLLYGLILLAFTGGAVVLWWGEDQTSRYYRLLNLARNKYTTVSSISNVSQSNDGKLVYLSGNARTNSMLEDPVFNIKIEGFKLTRKVRYYQLVEHKTKKKDKDSSGNTYASHYEYSYREKWTSSPVASYEFHNHYYRQKAKAPFITLKELNLISKDVTVGAYSIPEWMADSLHNSQPIRVNLSTDQKTALCNKLNISCNLLKQTDSGFYIGNNPDDPDIGDVSITISYTPLSEVSILAQQKGNSFERYRSNTALNSDDPNNINLGEIMIGNVEPEKIISEVSSNVTGGSFITRVIGIILIIISAYLMPWDWFLKKPFASIVINGSKTKKDWNMSAPLRIGTAVILFIAGIGWYFAYQEIGIALLLLSLLFLFYPYLKTIIANNGSRTKNKDADEFMHLDESDKK